MKISAKQIKDLQKAAKKAQKNSYAPYSNFHVGSAILTKAGQIFSGCNIENASFGGTVCGERVAIWNSLSQGDRSGVAAVYVVADAKEAWPPCGLCRQVLMEFSTPTTVIISEGTSGETTHSTMDQLLPQAFGPKNMKSRKN